jgi:poly(3-hydroxybutyrate) depolymerase
MMALAFLALAANASAVMTERKVTATGKVPYILVLPDNYDSKKSHDLIVPLHGAGDSAANLAQVWSPVVTKRGNTIVAVPQGSIGQGAAFTWNSTDAPRILEVVEHVLKNYSVDPKCVLLTGFSAGCGMGFIVIAQKPELFALFGGIAGAIPPQFPIQNLKNAAGKVPIYYAVGTQDGNNAGVFTPTVNALRKMGFEVKGEQPNCGHTLRAEEVKSMLAFFDSLKKQGHEKDK